MGRIVWAVLLVLACVACSLPEARAQGRRAGADAVVRRFYDWYLGRIVKDDLFPLENRRAALKYLTPEFRVRAPRISGRQDADVFICAQDWQAEWGKTLTFTPARVRGAKATTWVAWSYGGETYRINVTLRKIGGAWKIDGAACDL